MWNVSLAERAWKEAMEIAATLKKLDPETVVLIAEHPELQNLSMARALLASSGRPVGLLSKRLADCSGKL